MRGLEAVVDLKIADESLLIALGGLRRWGRSHIFDFDPSEHLDQDGMSSPLMAVCQPLGESMEYATSYRQEGRLSISHDADYAIATVIAAPLYKEIQNVFLKRHGLYNRPLQSMLRKVDVN